MRYAWGHSRLDSFWRLVDISHRGHFDCFDIEKRVRNSNPTAIVTDPSRNFRARRTKHPSHLAKARDRARHFGTRYFADVFRNYPYDCAEKSEG